MKLRFASVAAGSLGVVALAFVAWAGFAPIDPPASREEVFEIPLGTWSRRMAGDQVEILPNEIRLTLGLRDVLLLRNLDDVPQTFGPALMMPGQSFRLPFEVASDYQFACTAHASGQMTVIVEPKPEWPWQRIEWRVREWLKASEDTDLSVLRHSREGGNLSGSAGWTPAFAGATE